MPTECHPRHTLPRTYTQQPVDLIDRCATSWTSYHASRGTRHNTFGQLSRVSIGKFPVFKKDGKHYTVSHGQAWRFADLIGGCVISLRNFLLWNILGAFSMTLSLKNVLGFLNDLTLLLLSCV